VSSPCAWVATAPSLVGVLVGRVIAGAVVYRSDGQGGTWVEAHPCAGDLHAVAVGEVTVPALDLVAPPEMM